MKSTAVRFLRKIAVDRRSPLSGTSTNPFLLNRQLWCVYAARHPMRQTETGQKMACVELGGGFNTAQRHWVLSVSIGISLLCLAV